MRRVSPTDAFASEHKFVKATLHTMSFGVSTRRNLNYWPIRRDRVINCPSIR